MAGLLRETYYLSAYWGPRRESVENCAARVSRLLQSLARIDPALGHWYQKGVSRADALRLEITPEVSGIESLLLAGRNRKDAGGEVIEELGFSAGIWNGGPEGEEAGLQVLCGSYAKRPGVNSCTIELPADGAAADRLLRTPALQTLMSEVVRVWVPDWAVVSSQLYDDTIDFPRERNPRTGWMLYLSERRGDLPTTLPAQVKRVDGLGSLIVITEERFTANNPDHLKGAKETASELQEAGLLGPLQ